MVIQIAIPKIIAMSIKTVFQVNSGTVHVYPATNMLSAMLNAQKDPHVMLTHAKMVAYAMVKGSVYVLLGSVVLCVKMKIQ